MFEKWKQRKLIKKIKVKQETMNKLREEIIKMGKLAIKDGKIIRRDDDIPPQPSNEGFPQMGNTQQPVTNPMYSQPQPMAPPPSPAPYNPPPQYTPPPQYNPPPQYQPRPPIPQEPILITLTLQNGQQLQIQVPPNNVEQFMNEITEAINTQSTITIGNQIINGRYIISATM